ncbi:zinc-binding dehydrogenase [Candidatus Bandiella euplotis]|uniref:Zinc-binding dehydrogenase n=1 Tax=Candidatus Bandiella euplotis TaxID=1664265 RepID=A0ABZ0UMJ4_9RICK|nr:zinc-binding dehydrogenase [Candidatus Bandiella woodruffii]WPX96937.1 Putative zinc-binding dehydrogenase [Candidatus Bandiella woodruffii]
MLVKIKVHAIGVNRADILQLQGKYPSPDGNAVPGLEISGIRMDTNQKVCALLTSGGYSEMVEVDERQTFLVDHNIDFVQAAAIPEAIVTTWLNLYQIGGLKPSTSVLIHGGASGIGSFMVQFALCDGKIVYTTAKAVAKLDYLKNYGNCIRSTFDEFKTRIASAEKVDLLIDILGGRYFEDNLSILNEHGRLILFAVMDGKLSTVNAARILMKNLTITGSTLRNKTPDEKASLLDQAVKNLLPYINQGKVTPLISKVFSLKDYKEAHQFIQSGRSIGKVILKT